MSELSSTEKRIVTILYSAQKPLTTKRVSELARLAWPTAIKYLNILLKQKIVETGKHGKSNYWWLNVKEKTGKKQGAVKNG